jgi:hypothetical protein
LGKFDKLFTHLTNKKKKLEKFKEDIKTELELGRTITIDAVAAATPFDTGELARSWEKDSSKEIEKEGNKYSFKIASKVPYAKWVNNGHSLTQHFVPGLFIDNGKLIYDEKMKDKKGIMVGTKTSWVKGYFMLEEGEKAFKKYMKKQFFINLKKRM